MYTNVPSWLVSQYVVFETAMELWRKMYAPIREVSLMFVVQSTNVDITKNHSLTLLTSACTSLPHFPKYVCTQTNMYMYIDYLLCLISLCTWLRCLLRVI